MTQLMGRILRLPHVAKTGREALDACYVLCHDAKTGDVVKAIKQSLEDEGMGDLGLAVSGPGAETVTRKETFKRRSQFASLSIYLPRVTWVEHDAMGNKRRRELAYDSDILSRIDWTLLDAQALAQDWAPDAQGQHGATLHLGLELLRAQQQNPNADVLPEGDAPLVLDRARLVRGVLDIVPNAWTAWDVVCAVVQRLLSAGLAEKALAASSASLLERLRADLETERNRLAQAVFEDCLQQGWVEFRLRADATDYALPTEFALELSGKPTPMVRDDAKLVEKSLFAPALAALTDSGLERDVACYLDSQAALQWWHRNVAKAQYGLQGWKRNKVYPDFVFARVSGAGTPTVVVLETKGLHLAGSDDTGYKQALLERLTRAYAAQSLSSAGEVELIGDGQALVCDLVFDTAWQGSLNARHFSPLNTTNI
jgi:type III restriction enzyme